MTTVLFSNRGKQKVFKILNTKIYLQFSSSVSVALKKEAFTGNAHHEFVREICTHISSNGVYTLTRWKETRLPSL